MLLEAAERQLQNDEVLENGSEHDFIIPPEDYIIWIRKLQLSLTINGHAL